ncbi:MAG: PqqD family peptide modification chaperone [Alphaproteobacteria bacterium]|nr:PqqD family peptide modification chaperone [Alphaproteobacteria bacterium]
MFLIINEARIVHDTIDGELVMINLDNGNYYTMNECGALAWSLLQHGADTQTITGKLAEAYGNNASVTEDALRAFFRNILAEGLVSEVAAQEVKGTPACAAPAQPFAPPQLSVFTDMQELLLLDPVHETSEQGWPYTKPAAQG